MFFFIFFIFFIFVTSVLGARLQNVLGGPKFGICFMFFIFYYFHFFYVFYFFSCFPIFPYFFLCYFILLICVSIISIFCHFLLFFAIFFIFPYFSYFPYFGFGCGGIPCSGYPTSMIEILVYSSRKNPKTSRWFLSWWKCLWAGSGEILVVPSRDLRNWVLSEISTPIS